MAPLHSYIRHQDADGKWWNFETTTGTYSHSSFIMENYYVRNATAPIKRTQATMYRFNWYRKTHRFNGTTFLCPKPLRLQMYK